jgi:hypothetical protein
LAPAQRQAPQSRMAFSGSSETGCGDEIRRIARQQISEWHA